MKRKNENRNPIDFEESFFDFPFCSNSQFQNERTDVNNEITQVRYGIWINETTEF